MEMNMVYYWAPPFSYICQEQKCTILSDFEDVNTHWKVNSVGTTNVSPVGINFSVEDWFHDKFLILDCAEIPVQHLLQVMMRVRHIQSDSLHFYFARLNHLPFNEVFTFFKCMHTTLYIYYRREH